MNVRRYLIGALVAVFGAFVGPLAMVLIAYLAGASVDHLGGAALMVGVGAPLLAGVLLALWSFYCVIIVVAQKWSTDNG